ncbi:uncharacterized protein MONOS_15401 [Monocercomonoides exilis]|uniref:uncharacterized protein n=1 Tax=Monocercomonoides exilis TaxID=2049356 RepID=UPI00355A94E6|nr:hypothetical protein MONOS_15401 [Monocercomonoides exilis]|eukprot:MONOS_15401.1-p1 / transcript=MONOS_15401.1 / gene=MONOS_15401 / organism=Monocercomonoides_exilis_PA203 / gene_product=unspecified product / transcript_product=unspecified product / location=Mono_scaffold01222:1387-1761(-) / protein_length=125 / sequence_SO=supercontig / SO=protein_coding / is_pseudo=false
MSHESIFERAGLNEFDGANVIAVQIEYPSANDNGNGTRVTPEFYVELPETPIAAPDFRAEDEKFRRRMKNALYISLGCFISVVFVITMLVIVLMKKQRKKLFREGMNHNSVQDIAYYQSGFALN